MTMLMMLKMMPMTCEVTLSMAARVRSRLILDSLSWLTNSLKEEKAYMHHDYHPGFVLKFSSINEKG